MKLSINWSLSVPAIPQYTTYWYSWVVLLSRSHWPDTAWWWRRWAGSRPCRSRWQNEKMLFHPDEILCHYWECQGYHTGQLEEKWENERERGSCISMTFSSMTVVIYRDCAKVSKCRVLRWSQSISLRLQKGCVPDQVPLGKHILSEEPIRSKPSEQLKWTLERILKSVCSLEPWEGMPGSPQEPAVSPTERENKKTELDPDFKTRILDSPQTSCIFKQLLIDPIEEERTDKEQKICSVRWRLASITTSIMFSGYSSMKCLLTAHTCWWQGAYVCHKSVCVCWWVLCVIHAVPL